ncbi:MAG: hypothetical protein SNJ78_07090, partial [Spirochaetales bacterium]
MTSRKDLVDIALIKLLEIKDSDLRISILEQGRSAVDKGIHIGGAFSSVIPMVCLYYGNILKYKVEQPTAAGQDLFVLSKGHAVATLASIYADLGYFPQEVLKNSRSHASILNGHPGPILPGVHTATGPLGQGIGFAQGLALASRCEIGYDVFALAGDGELQEGIVWEAVMYSAAKHLDNLCVLVDKNEGQLDTPKNLLYPMNWIETAFESFGWKVYSVDATKYEPVLQALREFKEGPRTGKPTVIICNTRKGFGGFSSFMVNHKVELPDALTEQEITLQKRHRTIRIEELKLWVHSLPKDEKERVLSFIRHQAEKIHLFLELRNQENFFFESTPGPVRLKRAERRDKKIIYS